MYADEMWFGASIFGMLDTSAFPLFLQNVCILRVCMYIPGFLILSMQYTLSDKQLSMHE